MQELPAPDLSPYRYAFNNPISFTDPDGMYEGDMEGGYYDDSDRPEYSDDNYRGGISIDFEWTGPSRSYGESSDLLDFLLGRWDLDIDIRLGSGGDGRFENDFAQDMMMENSSNDMMNDAVQDAYPNQTGPIQRQSSNQTQNYKVIDNTKDALNHYYQDGSPVELGPKTKQAMRNDENFKNVVKKLKNGTAKKRTASFDIDLTGEVFHVGRSNVDYFTSCDFGNCTTKFRAFVDDGFWDPVGLGIEVPALNQGQYMSPHPYNYIPYVFSITYKNPGYPVGRNIK